MHAQMLRSLLRRAPVARSFSTSSSQQPFTLTIPGVVTGRLEVVPTKSPFLQKVVGEVPYVDSAAMHKAIANASSALANRSKWFPAYERAAILIRMADIVKSRAEELALLIANEGGKPLIDSRVMCGLLGASFSSLVCVHDACLCPLIRPLSAFLQVEIARAENGLRMCAQESTRLHGQQVPMSATPAAANRMAWYALLAL